MLVSMNWVQDFVDLSGLDIESLIRRFTLSTAEVEDIIYKGRDIRGVVVAKILSVENHPDSKKLHLLKIDAGGKVFDCVCGAPNVREGMKTAFAMVGGSVGGMEIKERPVAGFVSQGMCCSEHELGISADNSGIMEITDEIALGTDIKDAYCVDDIIFEVDNKSLTNRPDLWGHYGIAREFSALTGRPLKGLDVYDTGVYNNLPKVEIDIKDKDIAYRYSGLKIENVTRRTSPVNMRIRLYYCGMRAINFIADLTNYIMLELSQPMHAFDMRKVSKVEVMRAGKEYNFDTLDGVSRKIDENTLMICSGGEPVGIAGVMGGLASEIEDDTTALLLESANFDCVSIRKTSTRLGLRTDASMRYEKSLDPELTVPAIRRYLKLMKDNDEGCEVISSLTDVYVKKFECKPIVFDKKYVDRYTGIDISEEQILKTLNSLGFGVELQDNVFTVTVPSWRATKDVSIKADIIEEITRIYGYDNFKITTSISPLYPVRLSQQKISEKGVKDILVREFGLHEVHSYIWCDAKKLKEIGLGVNGSIRIVNAMTPDNEMLRDTIAPTLLTMAAYNHDFSDDFGIFEIGKTVEGFDKDGMCIERKKLGIVLYSTEKSERELYFKIRDIVAFLCKDVKGVSVDFEPSTDIREWQHPKNTADVVCDGKHIGSIALLHPFVADKLNKKAVVSMAEIYMDIFGDMEPMITEYKEVSKFPGIDIDLTFVVNPAVSFMQMSSAWNGTENLTDVKLIDTYEGTEKSITLRYSFSSLDKTLTKMEVQQSVDEIISKLKGMNVNMKI